MTPAARVQTVIGILDQILGGDPAEKTLTTWARRNRYAGSGDRAAIRDLVFDALRCKRSFAWLGGSESGRGLMLGALRAKDQDPGEIFSGAQYAPDLLSQTETVERSLADAPLPVRLDVPDWLLPHLQDSLGVDLEDTCALLRHRAPVYLRINQRRTTRDQAAERLADEGIETAPHPLSTTALEVTANPRRIQGSEIYRTGLVELQDAASQAVAESLPPAPRVLDYCAGGGGKSLAIAARSEARVFAHDRDPMRMRDLPNRAARAGAQINVLDTSELGACAPFDLVLCDVPCSGSGAWRRSPQAKWQLTQSGLDTLLKTQSDILDRACALVAEDGVLAYATCSVLAAENDAQIAAFLHRSPGWTRCFERRFRLGDGGDGFYVAHLTRDKRQS